MSEKKRGYFDQLIHGFDIIRRVIINVVFFGLLILILALLMQSGAPETPRSAVLAINPSGALVDELTGNSLSDGVKNLAGFGGTETLLKDLIDAIGFAKTDKRVKVLLLELDNLGSAGLTKLQDLKEAVLDFKQSGKKVIAAADNYTRNSYYLASLADEIHLHPGGLLFLEGYGRYRYFYKEGLDKLEVEMKIFRVGKYKSAVEPFMYDRMSDDAREADNDWLGDLWRIYLADVSAARRVPVEKLTQYMEQLTDKLAAVGGDTARLAKEAGLVDYLSHRDQLRDRLIALSGEDKETHSYLRTDYRDYLVQYDNSEDRWGDDASGNVVAVITAKGDIMDGTQPPGSIGGDSTAELIRKAHNNKHVKAIVLKVDSGGGSAFASDVILRELEMARAKKIPVVASMGTIAASGGYWITMESDQVWAYPGTITGSIGIFGMFPDYHKPLKKYLGVQVDGTGTNRLAAGIRGDMPLDPEIARAIQLVVERGYQDFITKAAKARKKTPDEIHQYAQGRVWSGEDAKRLGLVDQLGSFNDAVNAAAQLAKLGKDFEVRYFRQEESLGQTIMNSLLAKSGLDDSSSSHRGGVSRLVHHDVRSVLQAAEQLSRFNDPNGLYAWSNVAVE